MYEKSAFVPINKRQRRIKTSAVPLLFRQKMPTLEKLYRAFPGAAYIIGALLGGDTDLFLNTASHQNGSSLKAGAKTDVSSSVHEFIYLLGS